MLDLVWVLSQKDMKQRYHQRYFRVAWAVLNPILTVVIFTLIFSRAVKLPSENMPYPLFILSALIPWIFFSSGVTAACFSLVMNRSLITRIRFPRVAVPMSALLTNFIDFIVSTLLFVLLFINRS